jgi:hypothetical protein
LGCKCYPVKTDFMTFNEVMEFHQTEVDEIPWNFMKFS